MYTAQLESNTHPFVIRYPRGQGVMPEWQTPFEEIKIGTGRKIKSGNDIVILSIGHPGNFVVEATKVLETEGIDVAHYDMRFAKPIDESILHEVGKEFKNVITIEDGTIVGGMGSAVIEFFNEHGYKPNVKRLGIPDEFIEHGSQKEQYRDCGYDKDAIVKTAIKMMSNVKQEVTFA